VHRPSLAYSPTRTPARSGMLAIPLTSVPQSRGGGGGKIGEVGGGNGAGGGEDDGNGGEEGGELTLDGVLMLGGLYVYVRVCVHMSVCVCVCGVS